MENGNLLLMKELFVSHSDWDSHLPMLYVALEKTSGDVFEIGAGELSTLAISTYCKINKRKFSTWETNEEWIKKVKDVVGSHRLIDINYCLEYGDVIVSDDCGLLFIDCAPGEKRKELIKEYENIATVIVIHDTEIGSDYVYGMKDVLLNFKYRVDYKPEGKPHTTAASNFIDVSQWQL